MKVLVFMTQFYRLSGAERLDVELAEGLNARGIHADVLSMYSEDMPSVAQAKQKLLERGVPAVHFLGMEVHPPATSLPSAIRTLEKLIREEQYDIVETSMRSPAVIAAWGTRATPARHIAGVHDVFTKHRHRGLMNAAWRFSVRLNKDIRFYAISDYVREHWLRFSKTPSSHTRTILNAINEDFFAALPAKEALRKELGIPSDAKLALFVGRLLKRKGIDTVLTALGPVLEKQNLHLLYVGGGEQPPEGFWPDEAGLLGRMKQMIEAERWSRFVHFLGRRDDMPRLMASSDVLVHPARIEGFGLVLAEALAAGLPVVASNVGGIPEVLAGTDSIMVPAGDTTALRDAVLAVLNRMPEDGSRAIARGRSRAEAFRTSRRIDEMVNLFEDILTGDM